jgi:ribosomal protein L32
MSEAQRQPALVQCPNCGHQVPAGAYCGHCGVSMTPGAARGRRHAYAASPAESVYHVGLGSTLFPHLARGQGTWFSWGLLGGVAVIVALTAFNLFPAAAAVALLLLPVLYLLYLYEARVYAGRPWLVLALAFLLPLVLGAALNAILGAGITNLALRGDRSLVLVLEVAVAPVLALAATAVGPILLLSRTDFDDVLDGVAFGAASGLAFSLGATAVAVWPLLTGRIVSEGVPAQWTLLLVRQGILNALLSMATASLLSIAFWLLRRGERRRLEDSWLWSLPTVVAVALVARIAAALVGLTPRLLLEVLAVLLLIFVLFLYLRLVVHHALLEEAIELEIGPTSPCPNCHRVVPTMVFCPACGMARSAAPKAPPPARGARPPQRTGETT